MAQLTWDQTGARTYETGVDRGVVYPYDSTKTGEGQHPYGPGVAWNGLTQVSESPSGADANDLYADNIKYLSLRAAEDFGATIEAYTYPDEFAKLDGTQELATGVYIGQQSRGMFGLCYRTRIGNDTDGDSHGYKLHLIYGATAAPSDKAYESVNDSPDAITFSWEINTTPIAVADFRPTATIVIDSTKADSNKLAALEAKLYGTDGTGGAEGTDPYLPLPDEVKRDMT